MYKPQALSTTNDVVALIIALTGKGEAMIVGRAIGDYVFRIVHQRAWAHWGQQAFWRRDDDDQVIHRVGVERCLRNMSQQRPMDIWLGPTDNVVSMARCVMCSPWLPYLCDFVDNSDLMKIAGRLAPIHILRHILAFPIPIWEAEWERQSLHVHEYVTFYEMEEYDSQIRWQLDGYESGREVSEEERQTVVREAYRSLTVPWVHAPQLAYPSARCWQIRLTVYLQDGQDSIQLFRARWHPARTLSEVASYIGNVARSRGLLTGRWGRISFAILHDGRVLFRSWTGASSHTPFGFHMTRWPIEINLNVQRDHNRGQDYDTWTETV